MKKKKWTKEERQYANNKNPDLITYYKNKLTKIEVRGSRGIGFLNEKVIFRHLWSNKNKRDFDEKKLNNLLFGVTNFSKEKQKIGYKTFGELTKLCKEHPEWLMAKNSSTPYYAISIEYFDFNYEEFK